MLRIATVSLLVASTLAACAPGTTADLSRAWVDDDRAPHFNAGAAVTGNNIRGGG